MYNLKLFSFAYLFREEVQNLEDPGKNCLCLSDLFKKPNIPNFWGHLINTTH